jgi:predicted ATPase
VPLVPSLRAGSEPAAWTDGAAGDHRPTFLAISRLLDDLAADRPVVVVLGDLQEAHSSTVELLQYLAFLAHHRRWLLIGTVNEEGLSAAGDLRRMIGATTREGLCVKIELPRLSRHECDELVRSMLPGGDVPDTVLDRLYTGSLGTPLFVDELVRDMLEHGELALADGSWQESLPANVRVPVRIRALVALRIGALGQAVHRVLALAAAPRREEMSLRELRAAARSLRPPLSDAVLFDALDVALESRILEERRGAYSFRHPLVRSALYDALSKHRRDNLRAAWERSAASTPITITRRSLPSRGLPGTTSAIADR